MMLMKCPGWGMGWGEMMWVSGGRGMRALGAGGSEVCPVPPRPVSSATGLRVRGCSRQRARVRTGTEVREERGDPIGGQKVKKMLCTSVTQKKVPGLIRCFAGLHLCL